MKYHIETKIAEMDHCQALLSRYKRQSGHIKKLASVDPNRYHNIVKRWNQVKAQYEQLRDDLFGINGLCN